MEAPLLSLRGMELSRLELGPGDSAPWAPAGDGERFLYVIRGGGSALVDDQELPLARESVLWLEPGEQAGLMAGDEGLEALTAVS